MGGGYSFEAAEETKEINVMSLSATGLMNGDIDMPSRSASPVHVPPVLKATTKVDILLATSLCGFSLIYVMSSLRFDDFISTVDLLL